MPQFSFTKGDTVEATVDELISRMSWLMAKLDSKNVKRLDTNETLIKSADGTTYINGPVLEQSDSTGTLRLKQGYSATDSAFIYALFNEAGNQTIGIDSNGNGVFTGAISASSFTGGTIAIGSSNNIFKADSNGIYLGNATFASAPFRVTMAGAATASNLNIVGGSISIDTDITVGNNVYIGDAEEGHPATKSIIFFESGTSAEDAIIEARREGVSDDYVHLYITSYDVTFNSFNGVNFGRLPRYEGGDMATEDFVTSQGYITGTSGYTGSFTSGSGATVSVTNGLITSVI